MGSDYSSVTIKNTVKGKGIFALKNFQKGDSVMPIGCEFITTCKKATDMAIQIGANKFIETAHITTDDYCNHDCNPNMKVDLENLILIALRDIIKGEEVTFNYLTTEFKMEEYLHFKCLCKSKNCFGVIKGFSFLTPNEKQSLVPYLSPYLKTTI